MDSKRLEILTQVAEVFMRYGIKSVTMDDIANHLKVSKKTLYKHFSDKASIVQEVMKGHCEMDICSMKSIAETSKNAIDELIETTKHVSNQLQQIHPSIHYDLEKYYPEAFGEFQKFKNSFVHQCITNNLKRGIEEGLYRDNLNPEIIAAIYSWKMDLFFDPVFMKKSGQSKFVDVYLEYIRYHIRGIASEKGRAYLKEKLNKEDLKLF